MLVYDGPQQAYYALIPILDYKNTSQVS